MMLAASQTAEKVGQGLNGSPSDLEAECEPNRDESSSAIHHPYGKWRESRSRHSPRAGSDNSSLASAGSGGENSAAHATSPSLPGSSGKSLVDDRRSSSGDIGSLLLPAQRPKLVRRRRPAALPYHRKNLSLADIDLLKSGRPSAFLSDPLPLRQSSESAIETNPYAKEPVEIIPGSGLWIGHEGHVLSWAEAVGRCTIVNVAKELDDIYAESPDEQSYPREYCAGQIRYMHAKWSHGEERIARSRSRPDDVPHLDEMIHVMERGRKEGRQTLIQ